MSGLLSNKNKRFLKKRLKFWFCCLKHPILNEHLIVFEAFSGKRCGGNLRAIYEELVEDERYRDFRFVWIVNDVEAHADLKMRRNTRVVKKDTRSAYILYAKAKYWFNNVGLPNYLIPRPHQVYVETWHGTPLKKLGNDIEYEVDPRQSLAEMHKNYYVKGRKMDHLVSPSRFYTEKMISSFRLDKSRNEGVILETGYPRNDALFTFTDEDVARIKEEIGVPEGKKVILYTPTWRDNQFKKGEGFQYNSAVDFGALMKELGEEYVLLFRAHHQIGFKDVAHDVPGVIDVTQVDDVNDLYIISDLMITDYSSTMFDYGNLKRPMVFYMYDLDEYQGEIRDFYFDINELPGPIVKTQEDLFRAIRDQFANFSYDEKYKAFTDKFNYLDDGHAAKRVIEATIRTELGAAFRFYKMMIYLKNRIRRGVRSGFLAFVGIIGCVAACFTKNSRFLRSNCEKRKEERCFLIGNGPDLQGSGGNDALIHYSGQDVADIREKLGVPAGKKVILYTSTWRGTAYSPQKKFLYKSSAGFADIQHSLSEDSVLLLRKHCQNGIPDGIQGSERVIDVTDVEDINELYVVSDLIVTDCSSTMYERKEYEERFVSAYKTFVDNVRISCFITRYNIIGFFNKNGLFLNSNGKRLMDMKDSHKGERCFLIGNGPSLSPDDLHLLKEEYTFGTNMVYKIFDKTDWRPSFHCVSDSIYATKLKDEIYNNVKCPLFTIEKTYKKMTKRPPDTTYVHTFASERYKVKGNLFAYCMVKATVLTLAAEFAFHMGFSEIYLLGVDCTNPHAAGGHFTSNYTTNEIAQADISRIKTRMGQQDVTTEQIGEHIIDRSLAVYRLLKEYADEHGIKIYNATRGGNLEVFPRITLEDVLNSL